MVIFHGLCNGITRRAVQLSWLRLAAMEFLLLGATTHLVGAVQAAEPLRAPKAAEIPAFKVRIKIDTIDGEVPLADEAFELALNAADAPVSFKGQGWSPWLSSTPEGIKRVARKYPIKASFIYWHVRVNCSLTPTRGRTLVEVETVIENGERTQSSAELYGPNLGLILWKDGKSQGNVGPIHIDTLSGHGQRVYARTMNAAALTPEQRPRKIIFADRYLPSDDDASALTEGLGMLSSIGINTLGLPSKSRLPDRHLKRAATVAGFRWVYGADYEPPHGMVDFSDPKSSQEDALEYARKQVRPLLQAGWKAEDVAFWRSADEPGWYYPNVYGKITANATALGQFHDYLKSKGLTPADLGKTAWSEVKPLGRRLHKDLPSRRLFYWTNRYVPWASTRYFAEIARAFRSSLTPQLPVMVNFNNFMGRMYTPGLIANNPERLSSKPSPSAAMGNHDWLEFAREGGATCMATEDWFADPYAGQWSFYASRLRSAAELSGVEWGGLVVPRSGGQRPRGLTQKVLSLVGHGSRIVCFYNYGPEYAFPGNCYSESTSVVAPIAAAARMTAKAEDLLPGKQRKPEVAILTPQSAQFWDLDDINHPTWLRDASNKWLGNGQMAYMVEIYHLYMSLQHAGIPVQFVDEEQLAAGVKAGEGLGGFKVLYVTAPDLPKEAIAGMLDWVDKGGTLVTTAGTGQFDRYHQPAGELLQASGFKVAVPIRMPIPRLGKDAVANGSVAAVAGSTAELTVIGEREELTLAGAKALASFTDGKPAITEMGKGKGSIVHFACYPGLSYRKSAAESADKMTTGYSAGWRTWINSPVTTSNVALPVRVNEPLIEVPALYSESGQGIVVTVLNWTGEQKTVQLSIAVDKPVRSVESVERGVLKFNVRDGGRITCTLPVGDVDMVKVYYQ